MNQRANRHSVKSSFPAKTYPEESKNGPPDTAETPSSLRKHCKRLKESRDNLKKKAFEKSIRIKALSGKVDDLEVSRAEWKAKCEEKEKEIKCLNAAVKKINEESENNAKLFKEQEKLLEAERQLRLSEIETRDHLIDDLKKNSRNRANTPK